jgi:nucleotide-binding universal stress UspA family protein
MNITPKVNAPSPVRTERDEDGRVIGLSFESSPAGNLPADGHNSWLVAIDGSDHAQRAVAEAADLVAQISGAMLHLVNIQPWLSKEAAETGLAERGWQACAEARALLTTKGLPWRLDVAMGPTAEHIVAIAQRLGCGHIVIGSRGLGAAENLLIGSVAYKVIHLSPVSVLVVR